MVRTRRLHQLWERILLNQLFILYFSKKFIENILLIQNPCICKGFYVIHHTIQSCGSEDYLVGSTDILLDKNIVTKILDIQKLKENDRQYVFALLDAFLKQTKLQNIL